MEQISVFIDGETSPTESRQVLQRLDKNDECCEVWETFHLIGDAMRGDAALGAGFAARLRARMEHEPTVLAPRIARGKSTQYALSAAASLAAVAIILTLVITDNPLSPQPQVAVVPKSEIKQTPQTVALPQPVPAVNQARVNEYLMAHQEYSPSTTLQGVAPYIRTVSAAQNGGGR